MDIEITYKDGYIEVHKDAVGHTYDSALKQVKISLYHIREPFTIRPDITIHVNDLKQLRYTFHVERL